MAEHKPVKKLQHRSQEKITAQKPGKNDCTKAGKKWLHRRQEKKGFFGHPWIIFPISLSISAKKKIAIKNVLRYKHKINGWDGHEKISVYQMTNGQKSW